MTRYQIQLLRYINLTDNRSAKTLGLTKPEVGPLHNEGLVDLPIEGYDGSYIRVSSIGKEFLDNLGAGTFGNPHWDDETFRGMMMRHSLHG